MRSSEAHTIWRHLKRLSIELDGVLDAIDQLSDEEERRAFRKAWAEVVGTIYIEIKKPLLAVHPSLEDI